MSRRTTFCRRDLFKLAAASFAGASASGWLPALAAQAAGDPARKRACILLWMTGGPSQTDTFDMKPEHKNGGEFKPIETSAPGVQISEHFPQLAKQMHHAAVVRSMSTKEGDHTRATYHLRTGYRSQGPIQFPTLGSVLSKELGSDDAELPNFVSISPYQFLSPAAYGPGFLGPQYAPLVVGGGNAGIAARPGEDYAQNLRVRNLDLPTGVSTEHADARLGLLHDFESDFLASRGPALVESHQEAYSKAVRMMRSSAISAFDLEEESDKLRDTYGRNEFGQGCLLARRLVERGVPFVEVSLTRAANQQVFGWDTHRDNFNALKNLCGVLDPGWATLLADLDDRGLLDSTLVVWMGEFGRTPKINNNSGRDHFPTAWSTVLCGGGVKGGQVVGKTSPDGEKLEDRPVAVADLLSTICRAVGVDPMNQNMSNVGRPIRLADPEAKPIEEILV
jgi:uncharacterized protein (DUF1501 family)